MNIFTYSPGLYSISSYGPASSMDGIDTSRAADADRDSSFGLESRVLATSDQHNLRVRHMSDAAPGLQYHHDHGAHHEQGGDHLAADQVQDEALEPQAVSCKLIGGRVKIYDDQKRTDTVYRSFIISQVSLSDTLEILLIYLTSKTKIYQIFTFNNYVHWSH